MSTIKPFIKWSGSKRSQADRLASFIPSFRRYYEPFVGGGSVLYRISPEEAVVGDSCKPLIDLWEAVKTFPERLSSEYRSLWEALQKDNDFYYEVRDRFNAYQEPWDFLFLTRTCLNGLIRFNREGKFNTSFHIGRPGIHPDTMDTIILDWHQRLHGVVFVSGDFTETLRTVTAEDFVYLDPPYFHTKGMYGETFESSRLFECLEHLNRIGVRWMLSYDGKSGDGDHTVDIPKNLYRRHEYIQSGISSFKRIVKKEKATVYESLYLNF